MSTYERLANELLSELGVIRMAYERGDMEEVALHIQGTEDVYMRAGETLHGDGWVKEVVRWRKAL